MKVIRGHSFKAAANMTDIKSAHKPKLSLNGVPDRSLDKIARLAERIRMRKNINKYVHGK